MPPTQRDGSPVLDLALEFLHLVLQQLRALHSLLSGLPRGHGVAGSLDGGVVGGVLDLDLREGLVAPTGADAGSEAVAATLGARTGRRVVAGHLRRDVVDSWAGVVGGRDFGARVGVGGGGGLGGEVVGWLKERRPIVGILVEIRLAEEGRGLGRVEHAIGRLLIGGARGGQLGEGGGRRCGHAVAHDVLWRDGLNV